MKACRDAPRPSGERGEAETDATKAAVAAWQAMIKPALLGYGAVFFLVMMAFIIAAESRTP